MVFEQLRSEDGTGTLSYMIMDEESKETVLIDPNKTDLELIKERLATVRGKLTYIIDTHTHADHVSAAGELKKIFGSKLVMHENTKNKWKVVDEGDKFGIGDILRENAAFEVDKYVEDGDIIKAGGIKLKILFTPGHTDNHISVLTGDKIFTGDLLLIGQAGRSDLPGGSAADQYNSLKNKISVLDADTKIYPGHDYEDNEFSYLKDELNSNPFFEPKSEEEYKKFTADYFPPAADAVEGGKVILQCGTKRVAAKNEPFQNITADELAEKMEKNGEMFLLDVREQFELQAFGQVPGVVNIPVGQLTRRMSELPADKAATIVAICQSGNRSFEAAHYLATHGYQNIYNLDGGTSAWVYGRKRAGQGIMR